jgi:hypothetical protein
LRLGLFTFFDAPAALRLFLVFFAMTTDFNKNLTK